MMSGMSLMGMLFNRLFWMSAGALLAWFLLRHGSTAPTSAPGDEAAPTLSQALSRNVYDHTQALPR